MTTNTTKEIATIQDMYIPQVGDMFEWCEEKYWCIETGKYSGVVNPINETYYLRGFSWCYENHKPKFIRQATENELDKLGLSANCT